MLLTEPAVDTVEEFVPDRTELKEALVVLDERFPELGRITSAQLIVRGPVLDPDGMNALNEVIEAIVADPAVAPLLDPGSPPVTHSGLIAELSNAGSRKLTSDDIDRALAAPTIETSRALLDELIVFEGDDPIAAVGWVQLRRGENTAEQQLAAERRITELISGADLGPTFGRTLTNAGFDDESDRALADSAVLLPIAALGLLAVLYLAFRSPGDVLATFAGMALVTLVALGAEGWLGPNGVGVLGGSTAVAVVIPVLMIALTVDYSLQVTSAYRAAMARREPVEQAAVSAISGTGAAVALGAATTALSFSTNVASPLGPIRDFGVLAAVGVVAGLVIMTGFVPAVRVLADPKRGKHNRALLRGDLLSDVPGLASGLRRVMAASARRPKVVFLTALVVAVAAGLVGSGVDTRFENADFLPSDSEFIVDSDFLEEMVGGADSTMTAVIVGDLGDPDVSSNITEIEASLASSDGRPPWAVGEPRLARSIGVDGDDAALVATGVRLGDEAEHREAIAWFEDLWIAPDSTLTVTGELVLPIAVTDAVVRGQALATTIVVAAVVVALILYFGRAVRRPVLSLVVVGPVVLVLAMVLATMVLLDIPYNALTATLAALTIGIGVDFTIHVVHRYLAERSSGASMEAAIDATAVGTGGALVASAATTGIGFGVLIFAPLPAVAQLGALTLLTVTYSLLAAVLIVPALLTLVERSRALGPLAPQQEAEPARAEGLAPVGGH